MQDLWFCILYLLPTPLLLPAFCLFSLHALEFPPIHLPGYGFVCLHSGPQGCGIFFFFCILCFQLRFVQLVFISVVTMIDRKAQSLLFIMFGLEEISESKR